MKDKKNQSISELQDAALAARSAALRAEDRLEKALNRELLPELRKLIGKTFKYRNGYSWTDKWWMYAKIAKVINHRNCEVLSFQITSDGKMEIATDKWSYAHNFTGGDTSYIPITKKEYNAAKRAFLKKAANALREG